MNKLFGYRDLLTYRVLFEARKDARQFYMGALWWILEPAAQIAVLYLVFGVLLQRGGPGFVGFLVVGFVFWRWFDGSCKKGMQAMLSAAPILTQIRLPAWLFPVTDILSVAVRFAIILLLLMLFAVLYSGQFGAAYGFLPPVLLLNLLLVLSIGTLLSVLTPFFPDSIKIVENLFTLLFFCSGIFYDIDKMSSTVSGFLYWNPVAALLNIYRGIMLEGAAPDPNLVMRVLIISLLSFVAALVVYRSCRPRLAKALLH